MTYISDPRADIALRTSGKRAAFSLGALFGLWRQRRALASLDDAALDDIGVSRACAVQESERPFWDVPSHWRD